MKEICSFRSVERQDVPLILRYIRELARYEKLEEEVVATEEILEEWLFDKEKAEVIFAVVEGKEVEDLYVEPARRGQGIGTALLRELARIAVARGCGRLEWWCLDWNTPSIEFYRSLGAEAMGDWTVYRISGETLSKLAE